MSGIRFCFYGISMIVQHIVKLRKWKLILEARLFSSQEIGQEIRRRETLRYHLLRFPFKRVRNLCCHVDQMRCWYILKSQFCYLIDACIFTMLVYIFLVQLKAHLRLTWLFYITPRVSGIPSMSVSLQHLSSLSSRVHSNSSHRFTIIVQLTLI